MEFSSFQTRTCGGHCIGVDPYYLAQKAQEIGYHPEIILAGRRLNDSMGEHVATEVLKLVVKNDIKVKAAKVLILGITFKENCPDIRNTKVVDVITHLQGYGMDITIYDPWADPDEVQDVFQLCSTQNLPEETFDVMVLTVAQKAFKVLDFNPLLNTTSVVYDVKGVLGTIADDK